MPHAETPTLARAMLRFLIASTLFTAACAGPAPYRYHYVPGRTATVARDGVAEAPPRAPAAVQAAIAAGNRISGASYVYSGGHGHGEEAGYDCSGAASYVLRAAGCLQGAMDSNGFRHYGRSGTGDWIIRLYSR